jgi:iron complex transport system substrate-binding protein
MIMNACGIYVIALCLSLAVMPADASDFTLQIFGNANMDDTIDEQDIGYVQEIIDSSKDKTELADANHDGKIDKDDIAQIESIINRTEKELTILDNNDRVVTIKWPASKIVMYYSYCENLAAMGAKDKIVGTDMSSMKSRPELLYEVGLKDVADVGKSSEINYEKIVTLMPDVVVTPSPLDNPTQSDEIASHLPKEISVAGLDFYIAHGEQRYNNLMTLGYIVNHEDGARELIDWIQGYENKIAERTKDLTSDEKPTALSFMGFSNKVQTTTHGSGLIEEICGGRNLAYGVVPKNANSVEVSNEWIVKQDPDVIFVLCSLGWNTTANDADAMLKEFIDKPGWDKMKAVVNNKVYLVDYTTMMNRYIIGGCQMAKCLHPELFKDMDPKEINSEYFDKFLGFKVTQGIWMYPEPSSS